MYIRATVETSFYKHKKSKNLNKKMTDRSTKLWTETSVPVQNRISDDRLIEQNFFLYRYRRFA